MIKREMIENYDQNLKDLWCIAKSFKFCITRNIKGEGRKHYSGKYLKK